MSINKPKPRQLLLLIVLVILLLVFCAFLVRYLINQWTAIPLIAITIVLLIAYFKIPFIRELIGEPTRIWPPHFVYLRYIVALAISYPILYYTLLNDAIKSIPSTIQFSVIGISSTLGALMLTWLLQWEESRITKNWNSYLLLKSSLLRLSCLYYSHLFISSSISLAE